MVQIRVDGNGGSEISARLNQTACIGTRHPGLAEKWQGTAARGCSPQAWDVSLNLSITGGCIVNRNTILGSGPEYLPGVTQGSFQSSSAGLSLATTNEYHAVGQFVRGASRGCQHVCRIIR